MKFEVGQKAVITNPWSGSSFTEGTIVVIKDGPDSDNQYLVAEFNNDQRIHHAAESELREFTYFDAVKTFDVKQLAGLFIVEAYSICVELDDGKDGSLSKEFVEKASVEKIGKILQLLIKELGEPFNKECEEKLK